MGKCNHGHALAFCCCGGCGMMVGLIEGGNMQMLNVDEKDSLDMEDLQVVLQNFSSQLLYELIKT